MLALDDSKKSKKYFYLIWVIALLSTLGSLFFSEVMKLPPCVLCWYQRISMYPLALLVPVALVANETSSFAKYIFALAVVGSTVAAYHNLLYYGVISENLSPCKEGISCTSRQLELSGFVSIPLLSLAAFLMVIFLLKLNQLRNKKI